MNLRKLKVFVDLSKTLNYTDTAENLFTTQGNISKQILALEKELGVSLFERAHRTITLTNEGKIVLPFAQKIIANSDQLTTALDEYRSAQNMKLEIHTIPTMPGYASFGLITKFLRDYPQIQIQLKEEESYNLITSLKAGKCEIVFARTFGFDDKQLERIIMEEDNFVAVLPKGHQYSNSSKLDLAKLKEEPFLILGSETNLYEPVLKLCRQAGFEPNIVYQGTRADLIIQMVQNKMGVSIMTAKTAQNFQNSNFSIVPLATNLTNKLCFIRVKGQHSKANDTFWKYVKNIGG